MKIKTTKWIAVLMVAMMGLFAIGCSSGSDETEGSIHVDDDLGDLTPGNPSGQLTLSDTELFVPLNGIKKLTVTPAGITVVWSSSNDEIATVDQTGTVTGNKIGTATITAAYGDASATCEVTVAETVLTEPGIESGSDPSGSVTDITLNYKEYILTPKSTLLLKVTPAGTKVEWSSNDEDVATVSENGRVSIKEDVRNVSGGATRKVEITATMKDSKKEAKCVITVCQHRYSNLTSIVTDPKCLYCEFENPAVSERESNYFNMSTNGFIVGYRLNIVEEKVEIPEGVTGLGSKWLHANSYTNNDLSGFKIVTIPSSMRTIYETAFKNCENLKDVYYNGTKEEWDDILIQNDTSNPKGPVDEKMGLSDDVTIHGYEADGITPTTWKIGEK